MLIPLPYKILAVIFILLAVFGYGYKRGVEKGEIMLQKAANEAAQLKIDLEKEQHNIKEHVVTEYKDRIIHVKDREVIYQNATDQLQSKFNVSNGWVHIHDAAVKGEEVKDELATDQSDSPYKDTQALGTVLSNYSVCLQNAQELIGLQSWILKTKESVDKQNADRGIDKLIKK